MLTTSRPRLASASKSNFSVLFSTKQKLFSGITLKYRPYQITRPDNSSNFDCTRLKVRRNNASEANNAKSNNCGANETNIAEASTEQNITSQVSFKGTGNVNKFSRTNTHGSTVQSVVSVTKMRLAGRMAGMFIILPAIPIGIWWYQTARDRKQHTHNIETKVRIPNVQTLDEIMIDKMQPGDVLLFDRKCDKCAAGPLQAAACILSKAALCGQSTHAYSDSSTKLDHVGVVVPGGKKRNNTSAVQANDKSFDEGKDLLLLEATPNGIVARPLLERLEMSRARTVLLIPLAAPLERYRCKDFETVPSNDLLYEDDHTKETDKNSYSSLGRWWQRFFGVSKTDTTYFDDTTNKGSNMPNEDEKTTRAKLFVRKQLIKVRDSMLEESEKMSYGRYHSIIGLTGAAAYTCGVEEHTPSPVSPSAWLVVTLLQQAGVAMKVEKRAALNAKPEDFLRDSRFHEDNVVRLRPGWKFLPPVILRETSKSL